MTIVWPLPTTASKRMSPPARVTVAVWVLMRVTP
jgi:hypothetical protein